MWIWNWKCLNPLDPTEFLFHSLCIPISMFVNNFYCFCLNPIQERTKNAQFIIICMKLTVGWKHKHCRQVQQQVWKIWRYANADFRKANWMIEEVDWVFLLLVAQKIALRCTKHIWDQVAYADATSWWAPSGRWRLPGVTLHADFVCAFIILKKCIMF